MQLSTEGYFVNANNLKYIDFVKIQTGQMGKTALLGETSTEVHHIVDYHLIDRETE